jgi:hypothetical protein
MQRRASRPIAQVDELRIGVDECANLIDVTSGRRDVDGVIGVGRPHPAATRTNILQQAGDLFVSAIPGNRRGAVAIKLRVRIRTGVEQQPHRFQVPSARGEVNRLIVEGDVGIALEHATKLGFVASNGSAERVPNVAPTAGPRPIGSLGSEFIRLNHVRLLIAMVGSHAIRCAHIDELGR